jgi:UPF0716 protein FxsA
MILIAGALLLSPGFFTDLIGFAILVPPIRAGLRKTLVAFLMQRIILPGAMAAAATKSHAGSRGLADGPGDVIDVEVLDN